VRFYPSNMQLMSPRKVPDKPLIFHSIKVYYLGGGTGDARAEGNNATWFCKCDEKLPLLGRCYYQFGWNCHTICPACDRKYRVLKNAQKKAGEIREEAP